MTDADARREEIAAGLQATRERLEAACDAAARPRDAVELVVVTKTFPASDVAILASLGVTEVAENRDQEARGKAAELAGLPLRWQMIGQVQRNKAASVARWAHVVCSVDREPLVAALAHGAQAAGRSLDCLVQVCLDPVPGRGGVMPDMLTALCDAVADRDSLRLGGLMAVAPHPGDPDEAFERLARLREAVLADHPGATVLSAGMSGDLEAAVRHGATQVRIGSAILGTRPVVA